MLYLVVTFATITDAINCDKEAKKSQVKGRLVPIPRQISADCGMVWRGDINMRQEVNELLENNHIAYEDILELDL